MSRIRSLLSDSRFLSIVGIIALTALFFLGAKTLKVALVWAVIASGIVLAIWFAVWFVRWRKARKSAEALGSMLEQQGETNEKQAGNEAKAEIAGLHARMQEAVKTIKQSKLGQLSGSAALYELPWYMTIGNPAAGKSTAIVNSGLKFPFDDGGGNIIKGIGGTRNCDWFFTTEGILLDTAGRYSIHEEDRSEWLGFLGLLKKYRPRAPINGIIVTVSIGELIDNSPNFAIGLAKNLRQRVQELTEKLEVFAPVYVLFTKADLIPGFPEFFQDLDWNERDRAWGATLPYEPESSSDAISLFDQHFDELYEGLRALSVAQMARAQGDTPPPGLLTFPSEFASIKPALKSFVATLFEDNPFQFKPIFRGFYITSALQSGETKPMSSERITKKFALTGNGPTATRTLSTHGFFLKDLFSKVIFADRNLVKQYSSTSKIRLRQVAMLGSLCLLGLALGGWSWSYLNNRELTANVVQDIEKARRVQDGKIDLQSRLEALEILQDRLAQLEHFNDDHPISIGLGLYQGDILADKLRAEYYAGVRNLMLKPVQANLETFLAEVNAHGDQLKPLTDGASPVPVAQNSASPQPYQDADPANVEDAYNALKTYLMLSNHDHIDAGHLSDQITRFWRTWLENNRGTMRREQMIRSAEHILSFYLEHANRPDWPTISTNLALIDQARENLRRVVHGMPAAERVYAEIKARAATRFAPLTVASIVGQDNASVVTGSHIVSGAFTRDAWHDYVKDAIKDAATSEQSNTDWVLKTSSKDDLTLEGSPEQIQKTLVAMYKKDYADEWKQFIQGISVSSFQTFPEAVSAMNRLGDPQRSPIGTLLKVIFDQTSWDNPSMAGLGEARKGFIEWFKRSILRMSPSRVQVDVNLRGKPGEAAMGQIGKEFAGIDRLMVAQDGADPLSTTYIKQLSKLRTRLNLIKNQGDPGPDSVKLIRATLDGSGDSELAETLKFVDEQMLTGMPDDQRATVRPLLLRPLMQTFAAVISPAEQELNKDWTAQVYEPFSSKLAIKYPFSPKAGIEASPAEIAQIFGPQGAIAKYVEATMGSLVVQRGDTLTPRTWGDLGISLKPEFMTGFARWIAPLDGAAAASAAGEAESQTVFMLRPHPTPRVSQYVIEIDGQRLEYRNGISQWMNFVWPNPAGTPGARVSATTFEGRTVEIANYPGRYGLEKLINSAQRTRQSDGTFLLTWGNGGINIGVDLRIISSPQAQAATKTGASSRRGLGGVVLPTEVAGTPVTAPVATPVAATNAPEQQR